MKKSLLIAAVAGFMLTSCAKDYTCECVTTNGPLTATSTSTMHGKKKDVEAACESANMSQTVLGISQSIDCKIK